MITITNKELGEEVRYIILEFVNKAGGQTKYVEELCDILDERLAKLDSADEEKCIGDVRPADIPYDEHMKVVRENEELKETIVKLVKKLNECKFFD